MVTITIEETHNDGKMGFKMIKHSPEGATESEIELAGNMLKLAIKYLDKVAEANGVKADTAWRKL